MYPKMHFLLGLIPAGYFLATENWIFALVFLAATVLIDVDHYIVYLFLTRFQDLSVKNAFNFFVDKRNRYIHRKKIYLFHSIEFLLVLLLLLILLKESLLIAVILGLVFHLILDFCQSLWVLARSHKNHFKRQSILINLLSKRKE